MELIATILLLSILTSSTYFEFPLDDTYFMFTPDDEIEASWEEKIDDNFEDKTWAVWTIPEEQKKDSSSPTPPKQLTEEELDAIAEAEEAAEEAQQEAEEAEEEAEQEAEEAAEEEAEAEAEAEEEANEEP